MGMYKPSKRWITKAVQSPVPMHIWHLMNTNLGKCKSLGQFALEAIIEKLQRQGVDTREPEDPKI